MIVKVCSICVGSTPPHACAQYEPHTNGCTQWQTPTKMSQTMDFSMSLAGPSSHNSTQYMDFVEIFNIVLDLCMIYFLILVGVEVPL